MREGFTICPTVRRPVVFDWSIHYLTRRAGLSIDDDTRHFRGLVEKRMYIDIFSKSRIKEVDSGSEKIVFYSASRTHTREYARHT